MEARERLRRIFQAGVEACLPASVLPPHLHALKHQKAILLAIGKAAAQMAQVAEEMWQAPLSGLAVTSHLPVASLRKVEVIEAGHPVPNEQSVTGARALIDLACEAGRDDLVLVLLSGGASALAALPAEGMSLDRKQALTSTLLGSGASIGEINCVRRHLSGIKGGRLARAAHPARIVTLAISDVANSAPQDIGSGPTVADPSFVTDARAVLALLGVNEAALPWSESVKPDEAALWRSEYRIIASGKDAVDAAAAEAERLGYQARIIGYSLEGEAKLTGASHAALTRQALSEGRRIALISGGELTVTVRGTGSGGPNREYALALAQGLSGAPGVSALAADSDGIDGSKDAAGAFVDPSTLDRARTLELNPAKALERNASGAFFAALGDALVTGPTGTNVNDLRIILIDP